MDHFFQNIQGWHNAQPLYDLMVKEARDGDVFVEVGAWKGCSAAHMAVEIINSGKNIAFHVVDHFRGGPEHRDREEVKNGTLMKEFLDNMLPVSGHHSLHIGNSTGVADYFADKSIDFCYIDASHDYIDVYADIKAWLPKMKPDGLLAGDDYDAFPGVKKAVDELLPNATVNGNIWEFRCPTK